MLSGGVVGRREVDECEVDLLSRLNFDDPRPLRTAAAARVTGGQFITPIVHLCV